MKELTIKQRQVLEFLTAYHKEHGYPPTTREIGRHFGFLWTAARGHLQSLERKGALRLNPLTSRGIEIMGLKPQGGTAVPVAGKIRAGRPMLAVEDIEAHILIDRLLFPVDDAFVLKVTGDSMIEAGILDGDYVIVQPRKTIENGEVGVALIGDEATVKRLFIDKGKITLKPENRNMPAVTYSSGEVSIIGKVIGVIRKI